MCNSIKTSEQIMAFGHPENEKPSIGLVRIKRAFGYSWKGVRAAFNHEAAFRQECLLILFGTPTAIFFGDTLIEIAVMISCLIFILIVELLNSAIEAAIDRFGGEHHELSGRAKDMSSAAVLLSFAIAILIWAALIIN